jgi:hypothetical protein
MVANWDLTMNELWEPVETNTHQDHVIAHVIGASVLGYFILADAIHLLLDIGFLWKIYADAEMGLLPHPVAVAELKITDDERKQIAADIDLRLGTPDETARCSRLQPLAIECLIEEVEIFEQDGKKKLTLKGEQSDLELEMSQQDQSISLNEIQK